jgi:hypothetical protein
MNRNTVTFLAVAAVILLAAAYIYNIRRPTPTESQKTVATNSLNTDVIAQTSAEKKSVLHSKKLTVADDGTAPVPVRFQLPGVDRVRTASNFKDWLSQFPADQQPKISSFDLRHFGMYSVNSPEQVAWMAEMGYPMPEDVIVAQGMSDQDLRDLADHGNDKASFLLHEREIDELQSKYAELAAKGQNRSQFWNNDPSASQFGQDDKHYSQLLATSTSPFKGFVKAQDASLDEDTQYAPANVIAALLWAESFGDFRVDQFVQTYVGNDPMRAAMWSGALSMSVNSGSNMAALRSLGCPGFNVGNAIPGTVTPVQ